ncbi:MAG: hypothetical protein K2M34_04400 [Alphaproteobacteria bacterium]|nr:hypothetical protein [Alphaproteobacteria bacterium]
MAKAVNETFINFQEEIMPEFAKKFAYKATNTIHDQTAFEKAKEKCIADGISVEKAGRQMLQQYDYTTERENFLIKSAQDYIGVTVYNPAQSHTTSPVFLEKLANKIAEMLSFYIMRKHNVPTTEKAQNRLRLTVQQELFKKLFTENEYIQKQAAKQKAKRQLRSQPKSVQKKFKQAKKRTEAIAARKFEKEMDEMFIDAQCTPRKRR